MVRACRYGDLMTEELEYHAGLLVGANTRKGQVLHVQDAKGKFGPLGYVPTHGARLVCRVHQAQQRLSKEKRLSKTDEDWAKVYGTAAGAFGAAGRTGADGADGGYGADRDGEIAAMAVRMNYGMTQKLRHNAERLRYSKPTQLGALAAVSCLLLCIILLIVIFTDGGLLCNGSHQCKNGAACDEPADEDGSYSCSCILGLQGPLCETDVDECASLPCWNNATCTNPDIWNRFVCGTPASLEIALTVDLETVGAGFERQFEIGVADLFTTAHLTRHPSSAYMFPAWRTVVQSLRSGSLVVTMKILPRHGDDLTGMSESEAATYLWTAANGSEPLLINGMPVAKIEFLNELEAGCPLGYSGHKCDEDTDDCLSGPCEYGGNCTDRLANYTCACMPGYDGGNCKTMIDLCRREEDDCDSSYARCAHIGPALHDCICHAGYESNDGGRSCADINECRSQPCQHGSQCSESTAQVDVVQNLFNCSCVI